MIITLRETPRTYRFCTIYRWQKETRQEWGRSGRAVHYHHGGANHPRHLL